MKKIRKLLSLLLVTLLLMTAVPVGDFAGLDLSAFSLKASAVEDGFTFWINEKEGFATIDIYDGDASTVVIPEYYMGYPVKVIEQMSFSGCRNLEEIVVPEFIETIEANAFEMCPNLKRVEIRSNIAEVPDACFYYCPSLETIVLPDSVKVIGEHAFGYCFSLKNLVFSGTLTEIKKEAFLGVETDSFICVKNRNITVGEKAIGYVLSDSDKSIVFDVIDFLLYTEVPSDLTSEEFLEMCRPYIEAMDTIVPICKLQRIYGYSDAVIKDYALVNNIDFYAIDGGFSADDFVYDIDFDKKTASIIGYNGNNTVVVIPEKILDFEVIAIGEEAFYENKNIKEVIFSDTIKSYRCICFLRLFFSD